MSKAQHDQDQQVAEKLSELATQFTTEINSSKKISTHDIKQFYDKVFDVLKNNNYYG